MKLPEPSQSTTTALRETLTQLHQPDVRRLAWAIASPSLFDSSLPVWQGRLRNDAWSLVELQRCHDWLQHLEQDPAPLTQALGDPLIETPLGLTFEKLVLFWHAARPDVRAATRGLIVKSGNRTVGEFDIVMLRHDGVIETLEVTVKYYLNLKPELGINGCIGPRAFDRMSEKYNKMTTRQTALGDTEAGRLAICRWLERTDGEHYTPEALVVENYALARGYIFHPHADATYPIEVSTAHGRGLWQTDAMPLPSDRYPWRNLAGREWLGPYRGTSTESNWPNDPAMPRLYAGLKTNDANDTNADISEEIERRFVIRAQSGLLRAAEPEAEKTAVEVS